MNLDEAIVAHMAWKKKLRAYLDNPDRSIKADEVAVDNACVLGKWIAGEGRKYAALADFTTLVAEHARFHKAAAELVRRADRSEKVDEELALGSSGEFAQATSKVVAAIAAMKQKV